MPPNLLYLHSHDTGRYVQPYGHAIPTPHLQRFAEAGVLFRQAFCAAPSCSPSRAALLTGQWPHSAGMLGLAHRGFHLTDFSHHLVHTLKPAGYTTALCGVQHVAQRDRDLGYDRLLAAGRPEEEWVDAATAFLRSRPAQPFFLDVGFNETHRTSVLGVSGPHEQRFNRTAHLQGDPRYVRPPDPLPDTPATRADLADFVVSAQRLDQKMGAVLSALDAAHLADDTIVLLTTDHGIAFPGMKCTLTDSGLGVMLMLRYPRAGVTGGQVVDAMVSQVDVFPTLCDLAGLARPAWLQGVSLLPILRGEAAEVRDELFAEITYHAAYEPMRAVRTRRWKYIRRYDHRSRPNLPNCDDSLSKSHWLSAGWADRAVPPEALYDLTFEPHETANLAAAPHAAPALAEMRSRLDRWMRETSDPLIAGRGCVAPPPGARYNNPEGMSPQEPV